jgi:hypothetical protein
MRTITLEEHGRRVSAGQMRKMTPEQRRQRAMLGGQARALKLTNPSDPAREAFNRRFEGEADPAAARVEYFTALSRKAVLALRKKLARPVRKVHPR